MTEPLFVVLGAGASRACMSAELAGAKLGPSAVEMPPLVEGLFSGRTAMKVLERYPQAEAAAPAIRQRDESLAIEDWIRTRYRDTDYEADKKKFLSITYYLQELLLTFSDRFRHQPDNYDLLIDHLLQELEDVVFITLNYDLLLDRQLSSHLNPITGLRAYVNPANRWSLKLHGSVNWGKRITSPGPDPANPPPDLLDHVDEEFVFAALGSDIGRMRTGENPNETFPTFPALAVPTGPEDTLTCPPEHERFLTERLHDADGLDLLIIGYSGLDKQITRLIQGSGTPIRSLYVVDRDEQRAGEIARALCVDFGLERHSGFATGDFERFAQLGGLSSYLEVLKKRRERPEGQWPISLNTAPLRPDR